MTISDIKGDTQRLEVLTYEPGDGFGFGFGFESSVGPGPRYIAVREDELILCEVKRRCFGEYLSTHFKDLGHGLLEV